MKYQVRMPDNPEGVLEYGSLRELTQAYLSGLIGPDDEIKEVDKEKWRKANTFPALVGARKHGNQIWGGTQFLWMVITVVMGTFAFWLIHRGVKEESYMLMGSGLLVALALSGLLIRVTTNAFKRGKPG